MSIAITEDHRALAETAADFLTRRGSRAAARALLEAPSEGMPDMWDELRSLGWLGLHVPEKHGGSGYGLEELVVVVEQLGRAIAPGPFVPTVIASAVLTAAGWPTGRSPAPWRWPAGSSCATARPTARPGPSSAGACPT
jgi:alkylation response protein AidB-like acyl-CoA dehydrogenase